MESICCNLCGQDSAQPWVIARDRGFGRFAVVHCNQCGLFFVNPRPDEEEIAACYPPDYYAYAETRPKGLLGRLKEVFAQIIAREYSGYTALAPSPLLQTRGMRVMARLLAYPFRHTLLRLPPHPGKAEARILDIGCATGEDLDFARKCGWETYGVEINQGAAAIARRKGHQVFVGRLHQAAYPAQFFDAVMIWDVLEHLHDPKRTLQEINRILRPGGYLLGKALNAASIQAQVFRDKWWPGMDVPRHLYFYTPRTLRSYLEQTGFDVTRVAFYSSPRCMSECLDLVWCDLAGKSIWELHPLLRLMDDVLGAPWPFLFDLLGVGDVMIFHAVKREQQR